MNRGPLAMITGFERYTKEAVASGVFGRANTLAMTLKKDGKVVGTGKIVMSADGKTRTVTTSMTAPDGKKISATAVYDKE